MSSVREHENLHRSRTHQYAGILARGIRPPEGEKVSFKEFRDRVCAARRVRHARVKEAEEATSLRERQLELESSRGMYDERMGRWGPGTSPQESMYTERRAVVGNREDSTIP